MSHEYRWTVRLPAGRGVVDRLMAYAGDRKTPVGELLESILNNWLEVRKENPQPTEDEQVWRNIMAFVKKYPKSVLWMLSGILVGLGTGYFMACTGAWGTVLTFGWLMKEN